MVLILGFSLCFFAFVRLYQDLEILSLSFITIGVLSAPALLVPISIVMSSLYDMSSSFTRHLSLSFLVFASQEHREVFERQLKSCSLICCQVGNFYHVESKAKLTMIHNVLNGISFLMVNAK